MRGFLSRAYHLPDVFNWQILGSKLQMFNCRYRYRYFQNLGNHPVHLLDKQGLSVPSAFIPFWDFGGNISAVGEHMPEFDLPVCNKFKTKMFEGQRCY